MKEVHELEIYSPIEGFPNYLVTSHGRVLSLKDNHGKDRIKELKQCNHISGYMHVVLFKNGKGYNKKVHRLVAQSFISNPNNKPCINHIDENKTNNRVSNLEWVTHKENNNHGTHNQKMSISRKGKCLGINHPNHKSVIGFKINGCDIKYYKCIKESENDGFIQDGVSSCCRGKRKSHKGYTWYYADEFFNRKD